MIKEILKVKVKKILFRSKDNGYSVLSTKLLKSESENSASIINNPIVVGTFLSVNEGDTLIVTGSWGYDKQNRYQFRMATYETEIPATTEAMVEYLKRTVDGIGPKTARKIVDHFGASTLEIIKNDHMRLSEVKGLGSKRINEIHKTFTENTEFEKLVMFLYPLGVSHMEIVRIYDSIGNGAINQIRSNPYSLFGLVNKISFFTLDKMASKLGIKPDSNERVSAGIDYYIKSSMINQGNLFVYQDDLLSDLEAFLKYVGDKHFNSSYSISNKLILSVLDEKITSKSITVEYDRQRRECLYSQFYAMVENSIVSNIKLMTERPNYNYVDPKKISNIIDKYEESTGMRLATNQRKAVEMALSNKISILSGGPGTGKTQTINTIIKTIKSANPEASIQLAAPTGKAAKRMEQLTGMTAKTIHRMIGLNGLDDSDELIPVESNYLIIDESSMIDAYLFHVLLSQLSDDTSLLIVGDHEQLPSVGPGLILRDLMDSEKVPTIRLTEIFRQAEDSKIILNAKNAFIGNKEGIKIDKTKDGDFYFIQKRDVFSIRNTVLQSVKNMINNRNYKLSDIQVLSMMNKGPLGTISLNEMLQKEFNDNPIRINIGEKEFRKNDRVMQTVNNYDLDIYNGDTGIITHIIEDGKDREIIVDYDGHEVAYSKEFLNEIVLAYATTIHKSQGSEYPVVIMPFHETLDILTNKSMINTAWTRASEVVVNVGSIDSMYKGILVSDNIVRNSLIIEKLSA